MSLICYYKRVKGWYLNINLKIIKKKKKKIKKKLGGYI